MQGIRRLWSGLPSTWRGPQSLLSKVVLEERGGKVIFHTKYNPYFKENLKLFAVTDFIASL